MRTTSSSGITATGLKKWKPTTRSGCSSRPAIAVTDSDEVLVASTVSGRTTFSRSAKTCCLTVEVLEHRLDDEVGAGEVGQVERAAQIRPRSRLALSRLSRPLRHEGLDLAPM